MSYLDTLKRFEERGTPVERPPVQPKGHREPTVSPYGPCVKVGWTRAEGNHMTGVIEYLHTDPTGVVWAFVTLPCETWTAVSLTHVRTV